MITCENKAVEIVIPDMYRCSFDRHPDPFSIVNLESRYVYANLALAKLVGFKTPDGLIGRLYSEVQAKLFDNEDSVNAWRSQNQALIGNPERNFFGSATGAVLRPKRF